MFPRKTEYSEFFMNDKHVWLIIIPDSGIIESTFSRQYTNVDGHELM